MNIMLKKFNSIYYKYHEIFNACIFFVCIFILLVGFADNEMFVTDEEEIFAKGLAIANGKLLYKDIISQHMPLMYYFSAFFSLIGVHSVFGYRIAFYVLFAFLGTLVFWRYGKLISYMSIVVYEVGYFSLCAYIGYGSCVLSEQIQQFGIIILYFEFLLFLKSNRISLKNAIWISCSIVLSFGSAFVSIFPIAVIFVAVMLRVVSIFKSNEHMRKDLCKDLGMLFAMIIIPWLIYAIYLFATGTIQDAVYWNYSFNREIYSSYMFELGKGNYGSSVFGTFVLGVQNWFAIWIPDNTLLSLFRFSTILGVFTLLYIGLCIKQRNFYLGISTILLIFSCATRGIFQFHALPCVALECVIVALYIDYIMKNQEKKDNKMKYILYMVLTVSSLIVTSKWMNQMGDILNNQPIAQLSEKDSTASYVNRLTNEDEEIGFAGCNYDILVEANRIMANNNPASPWFWEARGTEIVTLLKEKNPRVIIYQGEQEVWGYKIKDYTMDIQEFLYDGYTKISEDLYVRNDYYRDALKILELSSELYPLEESNVGVTYPLANGTIARVEMQDVGSTIQHMTIQFGTHSKTKVSSFLYKFRNTSTGEILAQGRIGGFSIVDNEPTKVIFEEPISCNDEDMYEFMLVAECLTGEEISLYTCSGSDRLRSSLNDDYFSGDFMIHFYGCKYR